MIVTVTLNPSLDEWVEVPRLRVGQLNRAVSSTRYPGGKGINVSRVVHELGGRTLAVALAGGHDGEILDDLLTLRRIAHRFVQVPGTTRNNYQIATTRPAGITQINAPGPRVSPAALSRVAGLITTLRSSKAVALSGSLPPGLPAASYRILLERLHGLRVPLVLDSSGQALRDGLAGRPWLIKPNRQEAEELLGRRLPRLADVLRAAQDLIRRGPQLAVISLGPEGAVLAGPSGCWHGRTPKVRVRSTVGAGDSLVAGFVTGYLRRGSLTEAFRLGLACGTATVMTSGTELCRRRDVQRLLPRIRLVKGV